MYKPDSAQLVVALVLILLAIALYFFLRKHFQSEKAEHSDDQGAWGGVTAFAVIGFAALLAMIPLGGYVTADRNWNALAATVEEQRIDSIMVKFPFGKVERPKVDSIEGLLEEHAYEAPRAIVAYNNNHSDECEIVIRILSCPILIITEAQYAFTNVYGCKTEVTAVYEFGSPIPGVST